MHAAPDQTMADILFVTRSRSTPIGPGGRRRAYQIAHELTEHFGADKVDVISLQDWHAAHTDGALLLQRAAAALRRFARNPTTALIDTGIDFDGYATRAFLSHIAAALDADPRTKVVLIDDVRLAPVLTLAHARGLPCVICAHNLESLDALPERHSPTRLRAHLLDFGSEVEVLRRADAIVFISKTEAALLSALRCPANGPAVVHPYRPVGALAVPLQRIREARRATPPDASLFVMLGSAMHESTFHSMQRLVEQWRRRPLPSGMRIVIAGAGTERLGVHAMPGVDVRGWVDAEEMDALLRAARAVLVPQDHGFGAVTRLADMACAGVPVVASHHVAHALDLPPGVRTAGAEWEEWLALLHAEPSPAADDAYARWDQAQPRTLISTIERQTT
jgi:glycosyltransferase involved in cell wall biosynthesis